MAASAVYVTETERCLGQRGQGQEKGTQERRARPGTKQPQGPGVGKSSGSEDPKGTGEQMPPSARAASRVSL